MCWVGGCPGRLGFGSRPVIVAFGGIYLVSRLLSEPQDLSESIIVGLIQSGNQTTHTRSLWQSDIRCGTNELYISRPTRNWKTLRRSNAAKQQRR